MTAAQKSSEQVVADAVEVESVTCTMCGSPDGDIIASGADREYYSSDDTYTIKRCTGCGLVRLDPRPTVKELGRIYPKTYHSYVLDEAKGSKGSLITRMRQKAGADRFRPALRHFAADQKIDLLDVGCGNGWQMELFKSLAPERISTFGVEIDAEVCEFARKRGHTVYTGRFEDVNPERMFDIINLTHVIEHVSDPRLSVRKAYQLLRPGGVLVLETPNIDSYEFGLFRKHNWGAYHIPRHWYFFDQKTLKSLCEAESFTAIEWRFHAAPTHWVWTMHNVALGASGPIAKVGQSVFDPVKIFRGGLIPTLAMGGFHVLDTIAKAFGGRTSVMTGVFRKPLPGQGSSKGL